jgi:hypothetical protein
MSLLQIVWRDRADPVAAPPDLDGPPVDVLPRYGHCRLIILAAENVRRCHGMTLMVHRIDSIVEHSTRLRELFCPPCDTAYFIFAGRRPRERVLRCDKYLTVRTSCADVVRSCRRRVIGASGAGHAGCAAAASPSARPRPVRMGSAGQPRPVAHKAGGRLGHASLTRVAGDQVTLATRSSASPFPPVGLFAKGPLVRRLTGATWLSREGALLVRQDGLQGTGSA